MLRAHAHARGGKNLAVEAEVGVIADDDVAVLAAEDGVAAHEHPGPDDDAGVVRPLRVEAAAVVDHHVVADRDLVRVAEGDVDAEDDVAPDRAEDQRIELAAEEQAEGTRHPRAAHRHQLEGDQRRQAGAADDEVAILADLRPALVEQLALDDRDAGIVVPAGRTGQARARPLAVVCHGSTGAGSGVVWRISRMAYTGLFCDS